MNELRVVLIGGTSHSGKSTVAREVAERLGVDCQSTDGLARHPGRPWPTSERQVIPSHVYEHYQSLTVDELIASVLDHYQRLWPRIEDLIQTHALCTAGGRGLVLEGSAQWPANVAELTAPCTAAVWLSTDEHVLSARMHSTSNFDQMAAPDRNAVDKFLARTVRYQRMMLESVVQLGLDRVHTSDDRSPGELAEAVLAAAAAQHAVGRSGIAPT